MEQITNIDKFLKIKQAAKMLGVCVDTLRKWEQEGKVKPHRTPGGHRRYLLAQIEELRGEVQLLHESSPTVPTCHPEKQHYAKGLCKNCYYYGNPDYKNIKRNSVVKRYGVTAEWYEQQVAKGCEICGTFDWGEKGPCIDHNHKCCLGCSRCVRGVLCGRCNKMLGNASDDVDRLSKGIQYLMEHSLE